MHHRMHQTSILLCAGALLLCCAFAVVAVPVSKPEGGNWIDNAELRAQASGRTPYPLKQWTVNLDLAPEDRWTHVGEYYAKDVAQLLAYIDAFIPSWARPIVEDIGARLDGYKGFGEYGAELRGYAKALNAPLGDLVLGAFVYQLERIGINCTARNTTGPCPPKVAAEAGEDGVVYPFKRPGAPATRFDGPSGLCTSFVAQAADNSIWHGRNMDWNLPLSLREMYIDVQFERNNKTVAVATTLVGYVGVFNGMVPGAFSYSMDARDMGGIIWENLLEMLLHGAETPSQHARRVLESAKTYDEAVAQMSAADLADPIYYIVGGAKAGEGAIVTRSRDPKKTDVWALNASAADGWFRLETNYDHWTQPPSYDNRRDPGVKDVRSMGPTGTNAAGVTKVMETWPTFNHHTDLSGVFCPAKNVYQSMYWSD